MPEAANTRARLLNAAVFVIDQGGVKALKVRDVSARAGVKEPSVYHYFGNRDGLVEAAQAKRYIRGLLELTEVFDPQEDSDLLNLRDEMLHGFNKLKYLLTLE